MKAAVSLEEIERVTGYIEDTLSEADAPMSVIVKMNIAFDEMFSNIVKFSGASYADVSCTVEGGEARLRLEDDGTPYNPLEKEDADTTKSAEEREIGGLGILMVKKSMDRMEYVYEDGKNILTLVKKL